MVNVNGGDCVGMFEAKQRVVESATGGEAGKFVLIGGGIRICASTAGATGSDLALHVRLHRVMTQQQDDGGKKNPRGVKSPRQKRGSDKDRDIEKVNVGGGKR